MEIIPEEIMNTKITISLLGLLLIAGAFGEGCEEEEPKPDYITVNVTIKGGVYVKHTGNEILVCTALHQGITIRVDVIKAGGERFNYFPITNAMSCKFETGTATFKLYREQPIEIIAYVEEVESGYTQVRGVDFLSWDEVYPSHDFGDTYNYTSNVNVIWLFN